MPTDKELATPTWMAEVRAVQDETSVFMEQQLRTWLAQGTLPTLALWHGRNKGDYGDCEVTALALYRDLRRARLDERWTLVCATFPIGRHLWRVWGPADGEPQAVNVNLGRLLVVPQPVYLAANRCAEVHPIDPRYVGRLYAVMTRGPAGILSDLVGVERLFAKAFGIESRL